MTISDFRATVLMILVCSALAGTCAAQGLPATASGRFESFDTNRDGVVSKNEYNSDSLFAVMDGNHNNRVSADELQAILGPQQEGMPSAADRIRLGDLNNDGE